MSGELPEGMKPWDGGDAAPADYDGGKVLSRSHGLQYPDRLNGNRWGRERTHPFFHEDEESCDIIAYTPMNPHQKPQEDVVVTQEDIAEAEQWRFIEGRYSEYEGDFVTDLAADFARHRLLGHEAGRRDMREAAGKVADDHYNARRAQYEALKGQKRRGSEARDYETMAIASSQIAFAIRALPTEPLGGEG